MYENQRSPELYHHGVKGMKWGVRKKYRSGDRLDDDPNDSKTKRRVKKDYNSMTDAEFRKKYQTTKNIYRKRVNKYGDPYMNSPLAKYGKRLNQAKSEYKQAKKDQYTPEERKARLQKGLKVGAAVAGTALATYGAYKVSQMAKQRDKGAAAAQSAIKKVDASAQKAFAYMNASERFKVQSQAVDYAMSKGFEPTKFDPSRPSAGSGDLLRMMTYLLD